MKLKEIYQEWEELNKPYCGKATTNVMTLHIHVCSKLDSIGNANPHWNKLQEIETGLRNFYVY